MPTKREVLEQLNKDELIDGYLLLEKRVETLEREMGELKRALGIKPIKTSRNSSRPPSQDQKANRKNEKNRKRGGKKGHEGHSRQRGEADEVIECRLAQCGECGTDLSQLPQHEVGRHQVIDLPKLAVVTREVVRYGRYCPCCEQYQRAPAPSGFEQGRVFGAHLESVVLYLHYAHPLSYGRVAQILREVHQLDLSEATLVNMVQRAQSRLATSAQEIQTHIQQAEVIGSDETGARVDGISQWQWVFQTPNWVYYVIRPSRSAKVIADVMSDAQPDVWVSDLLSSQLCHPAQAHQACLAHQLRDLEYAIDRHDCGWAKEMKALFQRAIHLHHLKPDLSLRRFHLFAQAYQWRLSKLLQQEPESEDSHTLWQRFVKHREALLLFLQRDHVPPTNNASEQALRNSVIYRKVTGGFRSDWGTQFYANILSILETARRQGRQLLQTIQLILDPNSHFSWIAE